MSSIWPWSGTPRVRLYDTFLGGLCQFLGHLWSQNDVIMSCLRLSHLKLLPASILDICKVFEHIEKLSMGIQYQLHSVIPTLLGSDFGFLCHLWVKMMSLCHGWGWQPPQTASHIHINYIQSVWAYLYAVQWYTVSALHSYTHPTWLRFWGSGSLVESKWWDYVMVEADSHLKLLPTSILDIYKVFEHIDILSIGIW